MSEIAKELGEVVAALEKATRALDPFNAELAGIAEHQFQRAAVNFLRTHHAALSAALEDARRWRWLSNKAWFVDAAADVFDLHKRQYSYHPSLADEDDVRTAIDAAMADSGRGG